MIYGDKLIEDVVRDFFDTGIIESHDNLIIALSGGMDSMCLLDVFLKLSDEFPIKLYAVHVNHGIRDLEAISDMNFVKKYCDSIDVKLFIRNVDAVSYSKKEKMSLEEAARILRYKELNEVYKEISLKGNTHILVAHHEQDQVETIIHNLVRGSGIKGLIGMKSVKDHIVRPFLYTKKSEIEEYMKEYDIPYVTDSTNSDITYTRNHIRNEIISKLTNLNDNACGHIAELSKELDEIDAYIDSVSEYTYDHVLVSESKNEIELALDRFNALNHLIKSCIIKIVISKLAKSLKDIGRVHIDEVIDASHKDKGLHLDLPYNITFDKKKNSMIFRKNSINISMNRRKKV